MRVLTFGTCLVTMISLIACSNVLPGVALVGNQGGGGPNSIQETEEPPVSFHPSEKPAHPASTETLAKIFGDLKAAAFYVPEDAAYFNSIIVGETVRDIYYGSYDYNRAYNKLSSEGRSFVKKLLRTCKFTQAKKTETGKPQPGNTVKMNLSMGSEGCDYQIKKSVDKTTVYSNAVVDQAKGIYRWTENIITVTEEKRELRDTWVQSLSNIKTLAFSNKVSGTANYAASNTGFKIDVQLKGSGQAQVEFANGLTLKGPVNSETTTTDGKTTVKVRFLGSTGSGDILILVIRDDYSVLKVYVNGEESSSDILDAFGLNLMEIASRRY